MQEPHYWLKDFELYPDKQEGALFYTPEISAHIKNKEVVSLLTELKDKKRTLSSSASLDSLCEKYNLQNTKIKNYLAHELKVIAVQESDRFEKVIIHTDDEEITQVLYAHFADYYGLEVFSGLNAQEVDARTLIFCFNSVYCAPNFDEVYQLTRQTNAWALTSYIANHYLIIDNIYQPNKGVPCHFCNFNRHQNLVMSKNTLKKSSWINYSRRALAEDMPSMPAMKLSVIERSLVMFWLANLARNFINPHSLSLTLQDVTRYCWINLLTGEMNQEQAVHWFVCQCGSDEGSL
jgi:McbB family protein